MERPIFLFFMLRFKNMGSREESEIAGFFLFSHIIRMMGYFRISYARVNDCPAAGARNRKKASVNNNIRKPRHFGY